jgi:Cys-tRNA(Pro) deacylase
MAKEKIPSTPAIRLLKAEGVAFALHNYEYEDRGGTAVAARELGVDEHEVIKTLVMEDEAKRPFLVLMHGDRQVSTKALARTIGVKTVSPCEPTVAERHTGYKVGGTSPFGTRKPMQVFMEETIASLPQIYINAGARGLLASMRAAELIRILRPLLVSVAI